jgi:hypothetical protein
MALTVTSGEDNVNATPTGPADAPVVMFARGGGLAGLSEQWAIYADGTVTRADAPEGAAVVTGHVTAEAVSALVTGLDGLGFFQMQSAYGENDQCADCFQYTISVTRDGMTKTVTTHDAASDAPPEMAQVLALIEGLVNTAPQ